MSSETKHTPGPWTVVVGESYRGNYEIGEAICGEHEANARLIAAAPELLAACIQMQTSLNGSARDFSGMLAAHRAIDAAIAKATG